MSGKILPLTILILALITPCFMAPVFTDDYPTSFFNHDNDDDYLNIFGSNNDEHNLPKTNLIFTPNGIFFQSSFNVNPFDDLFKNDDNDDESLLNHDDENYPLITNTKNNPFYMEKHFTFEPEINVDNNNNNDNESDAIDDIDESINESQLRDLINTISLIHKITEIVKNLSDDEKFLTNNDDYDIKKDDDDDDDITVIGPSNTNPNVDIKLTFDKFDDDNDKKDDSVEVKETSNLDDEIFKPELKTEILDEIISNSIDGDDNDDNLNNLLINPIITNPNNDNTMTFSSTPRSTEWDESDEVTIKNSIEENLKFVSFDDDEAVTITDQPKYKIYY